MSALSEFLIERLQILEAIPFDDANAPPWWEDDVTVEIDESTYMKYLDLLPPRFIRGSLFAFAEGSTNFTLFWQQDRRHFARQLSMPDTRTLCRLSGTPLHQ